MNEAAVSAEEIETVFAGTGDDEAADKCSSECVGGSANTAAMHATM